MSEYRLRQGHHEARNLWQHHADEPPASKSGECVGRVDTAELAAEIVQAVNAARDAADGRPDAELERLRKRETEASEAVWVHPGVRSGTACIGGTRIPVDQVVALMASADTEGVAEYYPSVTPEGARAAAAFADRFVDRRARDRTDTDPRTEVDAHWGGDPEQIVSAWEADRAALKERADDETEAARSARASVLLMRRELDQARADLTAATVFWWDDGRIRVGRNADGDYRVSWPHPANSPRHGHPWTEDYPDRGAALARARRLAEEGQ